MTKQTFSLYKLPLVACLTVAIIFVVLQVIFISSGYSDSAFFHYMDWFDYLIILLSFALSFSVLLGFLMIVFYHFKINRFTKRNIQFTICLICALMFVLVAISFLFSELLNNFAIELWALIILGATMIAPFIGTIVVFIAVKIFKSRLDDYKGAVPSNIHHYYWRFANALAVLTFYTFFIYILNIIIPISAYLTSFQISWRINISDILFITLYPMMIYLPTFVFLKKGRLDNLYLKESFITAFYITILFSVLAVIFGSIADGLVYYLAFVRIGLFELLFYSLVILTIGFFMVLGVVNFGLRDVMQKN